MGPPQYGWSNGNEQGGRRWFRRRACLLKGCERHFRPSHWQERYCSTACQEAARRWRCWHASQRYRATAEGRERRRGQSRRYRERVRERPSVAAAATVPCPETSAAAAALAPGEGQRPTINLADYGGRACRRPGCYAVFAVTARSPEQQFCSCACRRALRRVRDREARWRCRQRRRRPGYRPRPRPPPNTS